MDEYIEILTGDDIRNVNKNVIGSNNIVEYRPVEGCLSSFYYYEGKENQIASIVLSLVKGHFFADGNKRTATTVLKMLMHMNNIVVEPAQEKAAEVILTAAESDLSVEEFSKLLFGE